jgi:hypothetical protein
MFGTNRPAPNLSSVRLLSALVSCGSYRLADAECGLGDELNWLSINKTDNIVSYRAVVCYPDAVSDDGVSAPPLVLDGFLNQEATETEPAPPSSELNLMNLQTATVFLAGSLDSSSEPNLPRHPPYSYLDAARNIHYSMLIDCEPEVGDLFFQLPGFVDWLGKNKPDLLFSRSAQASEFLFYWLLSNILEPGTDLQNGLFRGIEIISNHNLGGLFNLLFSDGTGIYAFSGKGSGVSAGKTICFRINRDEHNIFSYILRNTEDHQDLDWIHLQTNCLYYFPTHGTLQIFSHFKAQPQAETDPAKNLSSGYLSNLSFRSLTKGISLVMDVLSSGWFIYY